METNDNSNIPNSNENQQNSNNDFSMNASILEEIPNLQTENSAPDNSIKPAPRSIPGWIIGSILTCGLLGLVWMALINNDVQEFSQRKTRSSAVVILFSIITCSIYTIYWVYVTSQELSYAEENNKLRTKDDGILYIILCLFTGWFGGGWIIVFALLQNRLNIVSKS
ncbi:MAG: DUF4234 domain-containing protein [Bifidobacteriaceae bacterium]|jgi:hypothetical protein|nr:DUF4234 domain-containing protein [Bifidobacteriaceae bacterium]